MHQNICSIFCRSLTKVQFSTDQVRPALGSCCRLVDGLLTMLKNLKTALFQTFSIWHRILSAFTALYWPSTAFYWPSTTKYQPVPPSTDPVPSCINYYRPLLIQYHQVSTSIATYWPSAIIYQPVPPSTDPVTPSTNRNRLLLTQYQPILLGLEDYRLLHSLPWGLFLFNFWSYFLKICNVMAHDRAKENWRNSITTTYPKILVTSTQFPQQVKL